MQTDLCIFKRDFSNKWNAFVWGPLEKHVVVTDRARIHDFAVILLWKNVFEVNDSTNYSANHITICKHFNNMTFTNTNCG